MRAKFWAGLNTYRPIDVPNLMQNLNRPESRTVAQEIFEHATTVVVNSDAEPSSRNNRESPKSAIKARPSSEISTFLWQAIRFSYHAERSGTHRFEVSMHSAVSMHELEAASAISPLQPLNVGKVTKVHERFHVFEWLFCVSLLIIDERHQGNLDCSRG